MKFELVFIPSPGAGHLHATVEVARRLIDRDDRLIITVIVIPSMIGRDSTSSFSYIESEHRLRYTLLSIDDKSNSDDPNPNFISHINCFIPKVRTTVAKLINSAEPEPPRLAGFVVDMFCMSMIDVANEFGVPTYMFYTTNATCLGLQIHVKVLYDVEKIDVSDLKDSDITELVVPSLSRPLPLKCFPSVMLNKEWSSILLNQSRRFGETKGILINTFAELEPQAMKFLSGGDSHLPNVYAVGPILNLKTDGSNSADDKQSDILNWLEKQPAKSVVFLCFGSMGGFSEDQAKEIAIALERSGYRFLWSLRRAATKGPPVDFTDLNGILPKGFLERTAENGKIIGWAPQSAVLENPAIGGFVSHCGWNSTLESLWFGVPIATWPLYAEQQLNAFAMVKELGIAVGIRHNFGGNLMSAETENDMMTADEIEKGIRCLMEQDNSVRERVKEMSGKSHVALMDGESSHAAIVKFIEDVIENIS